MNPIRAIADQYDIHDVLGQSKHVQLCPLPFHVHVNNTPSFSIYTNAEGRQLWRCHGSCQAYGDAVDLVGYLKLGRGYDPHNPDHVWEAAKALMEGYKPSPPTTRVHKKKHDIPNDLWKSFPLRQEVIDYAGKRGLELKTLEAFGVGQVTDAELMPLMKSAGTDLHDWGRVFMTLPAFHYGRLMGIKLRSIGATNKRFRFMVIPGTQDALFNLNAVYSVQEPVLIVKGEISAMNAWQRGFTHVAAPTCGEARINPDWKFFVSWAKKRVYIGDNDSERVEKILEKKTIERLDVLNAELHRPPPEFGDLDDWLLGDPGAVATIKEWLWA